MTKKEKSKVQSGANAPDIINELLAFGGSISFHTGEVNRKFTAKNEIAEHGWWHATDGDGTSYQIPYRLTAVLGKPVRLKLRQKDGE